MSEDTRAQKSIHFVEFMKQTGFVYASNLRSLKLESIYNYYHECGFLHSQGNSSLYLKQQAKLPVAQ